MDLFTYLMAKKGQNTGRDLFSYLLGKNAGGSGTYTTFSGISLNISNTVFGNIKNFMLNSTDLTQDGTPTPDNPVDVNVIKGDNNVKVENKNLAPSNWGENFVSRINDSSLASITTQDNRDCVKYTASAGYGDYDNKYLFKTNWKENTQYTISYFAYSSTGYLNLTIEYTDGTSTSMDGTPITNWAKITLTSTANKTIKYIRGRYTGGNTYIDIDTFQVEEGIIATEYIEHQEQNYPISLSSKNLLNVPSTFTFKATYSIDMKLEAGNYTLSWSSVFTDSTNIRANVIMNYEDGTTSGNNFVNFSSTNRSLSPSKKVKRIYFYSDVGAASSANITITYKNLMLEQGSTVSEYEPYHEPIEYCKIGNYADQIFKNTTNSPYYDNTLVEGDWYIKKNIEEIDLSTLNWNSYATNKYRTPDLSDSILRVASSTTFPGLSEKYISQPANVTITNGQFSVGILSNLAYIYIYDTTGSPSGKMYYPLATPTYTHISETDYPILKTQLDNLYNNANSYEGQTNITQTNDGLPFNLSVDVLFKNEE